MLLTLTYVTSHLETPQVYLTTAFRGPESSKNTKILYQARIPNIHYLALCYTLSIRSSESPVILMFFFLTSSYVENPS